MEEPGTIGSEFDVVEVEKLGTIWAWLSEKVIIDNGAVEHKALLRNLSPEIRRFDPLAIDPNHSIMNRLSCLLSFL